MGYEVSVYHRAEGLPSPEQISTLLDVAGWKCALVDSVESLVPAALDGPAIAIGWQIEEDSSGHIRNSVANRDAEALKRFVDGLCFVEVTAENPFEFEQEVIDEMRSAKIDRSLIAKAQQTDKRFAFTSDGESDHEVDFQWALASAFGVLLDGILEDFEEGSLVDCGDAGDSST